ncbi:MAG: hypothetical protein VYE77_07805 [Planctomycetota bacterium]|nr:hypothetical protein [Planctomycetota bacterium]
MSAPTPEPTRASPSTTVTLATGLCLLGAGFWMYSSLLDATAEVDRRLGTVETRLAEQQKVLQLYRFEQQGQTGLGFSALLDKIRYWAPLAEAGTTPQLQIPVIEERLRAILSAVASLGDDAFPLLIGAFHDSKPEREFHVRRWLLNGMADIDPSRTVEFLAKLVQSYEFPVPPRMRLHAADRLISLDPAAAGAALRQVLDVETHRGLDKKRLSADILERFPNTLENVAPHPGFSGFVPRFAATNHEAAQRVLLRILVRRRDYDLMTLQEAVKALGRLQFGEAVPNIKDLFENPPRNFHPMFRNHCLDAIAGICGDEACQYFKQVLLEEKRDTVITKLTELIKKTCG